MRHTLIPVLLVSVRFAAAQADPTVLMTPRSSFTFTFDYAPTSEHIFLGQNQQRKLAEIQVGYRRKLVGNAYAQWSWEVDAQPLIFMTEPIAHDTLQLSNGDPFEIAAVRVSNCVAGTSNILIFNPSGPSTVGKVTRTCGSITDRAFGLEPLGQHVRFLPFSKIGPFVEANAGFLLFNRNIPSDNGSRFNFQFGGGAGLEFALPHRNMLAVEYRVHHISNAYTAPDNSGIDQQMFRVSYVFGR
jgi:hypothetical protein